jgi:hypothetical protein
VGPIAWSHPNAFQQTGAAVMTIGTLTSREQATAIKEIFANDLRTLVADHLAGDAMRNLIGLCPETRRPIDLQLHVDDATLSLIWSNAVRFQCPQCGVEHETKVERLALSLLSVEPHGAKRTRHQHTAGLSARVSKRGV